MPSNCSEKFFVTVRAFSGFGVLFWPLICRLKEEVRPLFACFLNDSNVLEIRVAGFAATSSGGKRD